MRFLMASENSSDFTGNDTNLSKSILAFDFRVVERPIYKSNSGPPLQTISLIPPHKLNGIILDYFPYPKRKDPSHFLVGYEKEPHNQLVIHPNNIRNYVSEYSLENWEHERSTAEEKRAIEELQPRLKVAERARVLRELKRAGLSRDVLKGDNAEQYHALGMPKKRGRPPKSMASLLKPVPKPLPDLPGGKRRPGRPRKEVEVHVTLPSSSHHHQPSLSQPSLSQPSLSQSFSTAPRAMLEHAIPDSESEEDEEEEEDDDTDLALDLQLNTQVNQLSSSVMNSPIVPKTSSPVMNASSQYHINKTPVQSPQKNKHYRKSPHNRSQRAPILPGMSVDAYPYSKANIDSYNENKSIRKDVSSSIHNQFSSSLQHLPISSVENGKQPTDRASHGTTQRPQPKIHDYFKDFGTKSPTPKKGEASRHDQLASSLKRKPSSLLGREVESSGKSQNKNRRLGKDPDDYLDADYKEGSSKRGTALTMKNRAPSFVSSPAARRGNNVFNLRNSRSRSRQPDSFPDEVKEGKEDVDEGGNESKNEYFGKLMTTSHQCGL
ncbi:hypothetical protein SBOR_3334 [Sclerotinia borealis F-4128]|uniref:Uncharacterized protein n=1 Tax=Sclerotinia borealis (strain F-4128) TaxID=1432307 RepID=W9CNR7_SCLBF|nr:hypothetical protein SBOR_3334 [Sclerotinia borealis F-4128]